MFSANIYAQNKPAGPLPIITGLFVNCFVPEIWITYSSFGVINMLSLLFLYNTCDSFFKFTSNS